jgi:hypothetical protein
MSRQRLRGRWPPVSSGLEVLARHGERRTSLPGFTAPRGAMKLRALFLKACLHPTLTCVRVETTDWTEIQHRCSDRACGYAQRLVEYHPPREGMVQCSSCGKYHPQPAGSGRPRPSAGGAPEVGARLTEPGKNRGLARRTLP